MTKKNATETNAKEVKAKRSSKKNKEEAVIMTKQAELNAQEDQKVNVAEEARINKEESVMKKTDEELHLVVADGELYDLNQTADTKNNNEEAIIMSEVKSNVEVKNNKEEKKMMKQMTRVLNLQTVEDPNGVRLAKVNMSAMGGKLILPMNIKKVKATYGFTEEISVHGLNIPDDIRKMFGYLSEETLRDMRKINPNAKMYEDGMIRVMDIPFASHQIEGRDGRKRWIQDIYFGTYDCIDYDPFFNIGLKQKLYQKVLLSQLNPEAHNDNNSLVILNDNGSIKIDTSYYEEINQWADGDVIFRHGPSLGHGKVDYAKVYQFATRTESTFRGYGYMTVRDKEANLSFTMRVTIRQSARGSWYIETPNYNLNEFRARDVEGYASFFEEGKWKLREGVDFHALPEELKKLVNEENGWLKLERRDRFVFRTNNTNGYSEDMFSNERGEMAGRPVMCNRDIKDIALEAYAKDMFAHGYNLPINADNTEEVNEVSSSKLQSVNL
jgi:hypothetical protein